MAQIEEDAPDDRNAHPRLARDVRTREMPRIWRGVVIAAEDESRRCTAADDAVDNQLARADLSVWHVIRDDVAGVIRRLRL